MFLYLGSRTDTVTLGTNIQEEGPHSVVFKRQDGSEFVIETRAFQTLRRAVQREQPAPAIFNPNDGEKVSHEGKIPLIKALRGLTTLSLRDAKEVVEYFQANYTLEAGNTYNR